MLSKCDRRFRLDGRVLWASLCRLPSVVELQGCPLTIIEALESSVGPWNGRSQPAQEPGCQAPALCGCRVPGSPPPHTPTLDRFLFRDTATSQKPTTVRQSTVGDPVSHQPGPAWLIRHRAARITPESDFDSDSIPKLRGCARPIQQTDTHLLHEPAATSVFPSCSGRLPAVFTPCKPPRPPQKPETRNQKPWKQGIPSRCRRRTKRPQPAPTGSLSSRRTCPSRTISVSSASPSDSTSSSPRVSGMTPSLSCACSSNTTASAPPPSVICIVAGTV